MDGSSENKSPSDAGGQVRDALALFDTTMQMCHACGEDLSLEQQCAKCGHDYCYKCASERAGMTVSFTEEPKFHQREHSDVPEKKVSSTGVPQIDPKTPKHGLVTTNPFFLADRLPKAPSSDPQIARSGARPRRPRRLSDCVPRRLRNRSPSESVVEVSPRAHFIANSSGSGVETHILCCSASRNAVDTQKNKGGSAFSLNLRSKINDLYRHAEDLHRAQYPKEAAIAPDKLDCGSDTSSARGTVPRDEYNTGTPTKQLLKTRLHSLSADSKYSVSMTLNSHDIEQDAMTGSLRPKEEHIRGYSNQSIKTISSSARANANHSSSELLEDEDCELLTFPEPLTVKHKSDCDASDDSSRTARPLRGDERLEHTGSAFIIDASPSDSHERDRYTDLRNEIVNSEAMLGPYEPLHEPPEAVPSHVEATAADELGIEGFTIVVHMKHKDDLVISTDLNGRDFKGK
ncbi:hypothetical protein ED733_005330 [Metarhizium rileyi]|uniref:Zinc finger, RING/FYVE/PHD-type n=1 Tax=Metarhizium rileyi (strain RCEF 4871) TaxID=1649241 RepID=A0A5C6GMC4_METRR|nr:hypothetical protein ED733_005330 [Metarhizium rileyi]